ncbi:MAG: Maf family protein [Nitrospiria bacterium]
MPDTQTKPKIILASGSPRRKEILSLLKIPFQVVIPPYEELSDPQTPAENEVLSFAEGKARSVAVGLQEGIVIGSDTLIDCEGRKIGKPKNPKDAKAILKNLQGRVHTIWTAVFIIDVATGQTLRSRKTVEIALHQMTDLEIDDYVSTREPLDKAGAYAVQGIGRRFVRELRGDKLAAIGMPLQPIIAFLERSAVRISAIEEEIDAF